MKDNQTRTGKPARSVVIDWAKLLPVAGPPEPVEVQLPVHEGRLPRPKLDRVPRCEECGRGRASVFTHVAQKQPGERWEFCCSKCAGHQLTSHPMTYCIGFDDFF